MEQRAIGDLVMKGKPGDVVPNVRGAMVVLDTNHLDQTALLKEPLTVSLLFYLGQLEGCLGLPRVIRDEWQGHFVKHCLRKFNDAQQRLEWLDGMLGGMPEVACDVEASANRAFQARLDQLGELLVELPIESSHWRTAGEMVLNKRPPSSEGNQQFKDSLIWCSLIEAGQSQPVCFVTGDKGFFSPGQVALADELREEAQSMGAEIYIVQSVRPLLELLRDECADFGESLDAHQDEIIDAFSSAVDERLAPQNWVMLGVGEWSEEVFATGVPEQAAVAIELEHELVRLDEPELETSASVRVAGSALVDTRSWDVEVELDSIAVTIYTPHDDLVIDLATPGVSRSTVVRSKLDLRPTW